MRRKKIKKQRSLEDIAYDVLWNNPYLVTSEEMTLCRSALNGAINWARRIDSDNRKIVKPKGIY